MDNKSKNTLIISIIALALVLIGVTYAYFSARITGLESASTISLTAGRMGIHYTEGDEDVTVSNIYPREQEWLIKTITLTGYNTTDQEMKYELGLNITSNTFKKGELTFDLTGVGSNGTRIADITGKSIVKPNGFFKIGTGSFAQANGDTHVYTLKIYFKDNGKDQNYNQQSIFNGKIDVRENTTPVNECFAYESDLVSYDINYDNCMDYYINYSNNELICNGGTYDDGISTISIERDIERGMLSVLESNGVIENLVYSDPYLVDLTDRYYVYQNGQYTYIYDGVYGGPDGWWVMLTDVYENGGTSTDPVTSELCTSVNGVPIVDMFQMFLHSKATSIDLSSFDTSNVTNMGEMFRDVSVGNLDLQYLNTSNVTTMSGMFKESAVTTLDLSSFDTSNVTSMQEMFRDSLATSIDYSSFDTSNVTNMWYMFSGTNVLSLDLSNFDTSKVTNMKHLFYNSHATSINLSNWDTSSVTLMSLMFANSPVTTLDLSSFDTSNVTDVGSMFWGASNLTTIYVSSKFNVDSVSSSSGMFSNCTSLVGGAGTTFDSNYVNKVRAHIDGGPSNPGYFTAK